MPSLKSVITVALSAALLVTTTGTAWAQPQAPTAAHLVSTSDAAHARDIASAAFAALPGGAIANVNDANVARPDGSELVVVAAPATGNGFDEGSYAAAVVDLSAGTVVQQLQMKVDISDERSADVVQWIDESIVKTVSVTVPDAVRSVADIRTDGAVTPMAGNNVIDCLNALGISTIAAWAIITSCAAFCAVTVGAGCIACVAAFTAIAGVSVGRCLNSN